MGWGLHEVTRELARWRALAERIPSGPIRDDALQALTHKRTHADGAALFSTLPDRRDGNLLRLLLAYELILDFLDNLSERHRTEVNGRELHLALVDAIAPERAPADYYRHHPWKDDGGYLEALVASCQAGCRDLPSFEQVRTVVMVEATKTQALALNHLSDPAERDAALRRWAADECADCGDFAWYELGGAASASLVVLALLTLGASPNVPPDAVARIRRAYWPWMSLVAVMLDSYADQLEDAASGHHSYVAHYPGREAAIEQLSACIATASKNALGLPRGHRHAVIVASMVAMYLSKDSARSPALRDGTRLLVGAGGSLARLLVPVLRLWRIVYSHRAA